MRVLIVEDDKKIGSFLVRGLSEAGYTTDLLSTAEEALGAAALTRFDALVLDLNLPGKDGIWLIERLRERGVNVPILILSARVGVDDRVLGIRSGADDYMTKPFSFVELNARIEALIRRAQNPSSASGGTGSPPSKLHAADVTIDLYSRVVTRGGRDVELQPREFALLEYFLRNPDRVLTKTMILEQIWNYDFDPQTNVVDVLVSRLRSKVDRDFPEKLIHTIRGVGYVLRTGRPDG